MKAAKCQADITVLTEKIVAKINAYAELTGTGEHAEVKFAYVVFRSMEGKARLCDAYHYPHWWSKACSNRGAPVADKCLHGVEWMLEVEEAPEPSFILWQNLGVTRNGQRLRRAGSLAVAAALVALIAFSVGALKGLSTSAKAGFVPAGGDCPPALGTEAEQERAALADWRFHLVNYERKAAGRFDPLKDLEAGGLLHCHCKKRYFAHITEKKKR